MRASVILPVFATALCCGPSAAQAVATDASRTPGFVNFEAPLTHALALSPTGDHLFATNAPGGRLAVFSLQDPLRPVLEREIPVGLEPVALAARNQDEVWVVNWLSDAISVVSLASGVVEATIAVGDEPGDIVFAGKPERAFVTVTGQREIAVIDPDTRRVTARIPLFGDAPRALCRSHDKRHVFAAALRSGNGTTIAPGGVAPLPPEPNAKALPSAPREGRIVRAADPAWQRLDVVLPDLDVFGIDANTFAITKQYSGVGTTLFDLACDPNTNALWVANTEARNMVRFEPIVRGHPVDHRLTRIARTGGTTKIFDLNPTAERELALAEPTAVCFSPDGARIYVALHASDRIAVLDRDGVILHRIEVTPADERRQPRHMRGPRALVHHPELPILYVHNGISRTLTVINTETLAVATEVPLGFDPTPQAIAEGRGFLYSAWLSDTGIASCSSCHIDGDWDGLAWDLGDPSGPMQLVQNKNLYPLRMHPMKGPMKTQSLRGLSTEAGPFHHRGDRQSLRDFNPAFASLLGGKELTEPDLATFVSFLQTVHFPPNPNRTLDNRYPTVALPDGVKSGDVLFDKPPHGHTACSTCHVGAGTTNGLIVTGHLLQFLPQPMKTSQLRDVYKRTARTPHDGLRMGGFGLMHDGSFDSVESFLGRPFFRDMAPSKEVRAEIARFVLATDTGTAPAIGWMMTARRASDVREAELALVEAAARAQRCGVFVHGRLDGEVRSFAFDGQADRYVELGAANAKDAAVMTREQLLGCFKANDALTFLGVPAPRL